MKLIAKGFTTFEELPSGRLFLHGETLCLKTEYRTNDGRIEAYIVGSGEFFVGGVADDSRGDLRVLIIEPDLNSPTEHD